MKEIMKDELKNLETRIEFYKNEIELDMDYIKRMQEKNNIDAILKHSQYIKVSQEKLLTIKAILKEFEILAVEEKELFVKIQELEGIINKLVY